MVAYVVLGGFLAVSLTDFVQGLIMMIALIAVPLVAWSALDADVGPWSILQRIDPNLTSFFAGTTALGIISTLAWGLGYFGQPHIIVRFMAIRRVEDIPVARRIGLIWMVVSLIGACAVGLIGKAYIAYDGKGLGDPETVLIALGALLLHPLAFGLLLSAILAAIMSTISAQLLVTGSSLTEDFYRLFVRRNASEREVVTVGRLSVVAVAGVAIIALGYIISGIGATLGIVAGVIGGIGTAFSLIGAAIAAILSPVGLAIAAIVALGGVLIVTTGAGGEALAWLGEQFTRLRDWVAKVVGGISDALAAGDIALAAEILWLSLKVVWQQGVAALNKVWLEAKEFFVSTAYGMWYGALAAVEVVFHALEVAWIETTVFLSKTWTNFTTGFQQVWESASSWVAKRMLEIQGLFDSGLDVDAAKRAVDDQLETRLAELESAAQRQVAEREGQRTAERDQAAALHEATLAGIGRDFEEAQAALKTNTETGLAESQAALDAAKQKLADAIEQARQKREAADAERGPAGTPRDLMAEFEDRLAGLGEVIGKGISVRGTFNARAAQGLESDGGAAERTARATEQTAKHTKRLADAAQSGGLTFA